jgi:hypothetical protein
MRRKKEAELAGIMALACTVGLFIVLYVAFVFPSQALDNWGGEGSCPPAVVRFLLDADAFCKQTGLIWIAILVLSAGAVRGGIRAVRNTANKTNE